MKKKLFQQLWCLISITLILLTTLDLKASGKPRLDIEEVVIEASVPALTGAHKDMFSILETQSAVTLITETLHRMDIDAPHFLPAPGEPFMEAQHGCLAPFLRLGRGTGRCMAKAARAWEAMLWQDVIDNLAPIVNHRENLAEKPAALFFTARSQHYLQNVTAAIESYTQLIEDYPENSYCEFALYSLGWLYFENNELEKALKVIESLSQRFPASPLAPYIRYFQSAVYNKQQNYKEALRDLEAIIVGYPLFDKMDDVLFWTAENNYFLHRFDAAINNYSFYLSNYPNGDKRAEAYYGRAFSYLEQHQYIESLEDFSALIENYPEHPLAGNGGFHAGKLAIFLNDTDRATAFFQKAVLSYRIDSPEKIEAEAWIDYAGKRFEASAKGFLKAASAFPAKDTFSGTIDSNRAEMLYFEAVSYMRNKNYSVAAEKFDSLASSDSTLWKVPALANAGIAWMKLDRFEIALQRMQGAFSEPEKLLGRGLYSLYYAEILFRMNRYNESIELFQSLLQKEEMTSYGDEILRGIAWNYYAQHNWENAADWFYRLVRDFPESAFHPEALLRRAECLFNRGGYEQSKLVFKELINEYPLHPEAFEARLLNARADWIRGKHEEGMIEMRETLRFAPDAAHRQRVRMIMGDFLQNQEKYAEAIEEFRQAYLEDIHGAGAPAALIRQADNLYNLQKDDEAEELYRRIIREFPDSDFANLAQYSIGLIFFRQNRLDQYLKECFSLSQTHPGTRQSALALNGAASILIEQSRFEEATDVLMELKNHYRKHIDVELVRFRLGQTLKRSGKINEAEQEFQGLVEFSPTGRYAADAMIEIAEIAEKQNKHLKALELYRIIMQKFTFHPRRLEVISRAASLCFELKRWDEAERMWRQYIEELGESPDVYAGYLELGRALLSSGDLEEARINVERAMGSTQREIIAESNYLLCKIIENQGDKEEALKGYLKISYVYLDQRKTVFEAQLRAVLLMHEMGRTVQAQNLLDKISALADTDEQRKRLSDLRHQVGSTGGAK